MRNIILKTVLSIVWLAGFMSSLAWAQKTTATIKVFDKKTGEERSAGELFVRPDEHSGELTQIIMGRGSVGSLKDIRFFKSSVLKDEGTLKPVKSEAVYYDQKDNAIGGFLIEYDHDQKSAVFIQYKEGRKERFRREFKIEGPICDAQNMPLFLEKFLLQHEKLTASYFYLISLEPKLYKVDITYKDAEHIEIGGDSVLAKKIQVIADMGPMTNIVANFLPKTYLWLTPRKPYRWLQYEGLEEGPDSAHISVELQRR